MLKKLARKELNVVINCFTFQQHFRDLLVTWKIHTSRVCFHVGKQPFLGLAWTRVVAYIYLNPAAQLIKIFSTPLAFDSYTGDHSLLAVTSEEADKLLQLNSSLVKISTRASSFLLFRMKFKNKDSFISCRYIQGKKTTIREPPPQAHLPPSVHDVFDLLHQSCAAWHPSKYSFLENNPSVFFCMKKTRNAHEYSHSW